ncbi:hypothetical protein A2643_03365 [Candidatus Nomurabacteria bacterium RIFCSPHIGHO2_01_FULL_39_220]|uniref:Uncharacterized protein n=1 Tax=Candidatus Nomurabacteria bacterium RIFCSPLOWO2_02_FULL_40_67 TaxID=1801787 RepID=A0A1F6Y4L2_9BACT|nr:MAG: hypothetical protein UU01_C0013G0006 [Parcubacteria group bacterium GW2011_GWA2_40_37]KKS70697.1 MAG: hypothetical protein UV43_C0055G0004 [Parcubacteria group bacterium GW2011_GWF2_42_7]OGI62978.1 MAG: hypothetical protein A2W12_03950 [Candidatus Nomurabacteria bacterium RBG_16_40_11]OGI69653.1 MAG: hypothetical protein A2643_03365 [Candidatus Nomurabacteria bacterium RIFCSPHIGHO2_01_FULL_39_220]OGI72126.1 MAG: hypothetical protein A2W56_00785 [Candidatus Nomurabacteria bacterium RIFCS
MEQNNKTQNKIVETYAEDMAKVIGEDKTGLVKKIIHDEEEHEKDKKNLSPELQKNKFFIIFGALFIVLSLVTLFYFILGRRIPTVQIEEKFIPLIFTDKNTLIEVAGFSKDKVAQTIYNMVNATKVKKGGVEGIYLMNNKQGIGLREFATFIKSNFTLPALGANNALFFNDSFLMGAVNGETKDFFILLKVRSITDVFDALRVWEKKMFLELHEFFGFDITPETKQLLTRDWQDGIVENKNARILYQKEDQPEGEQGKIVLMYVFADDNSVVITNTESAAREIMFRLTASQVKK